MTDRTTHQDRLKGILRAEGKAAGPPPRPADGDGGEGACTAFGYLRGLRERADAIEFRLRTGTSVWFPYGWLGTWKFDPSEGLLLKFTGDLVYLVLVRGSNLDRPLADSTINLTSAGLQRHRVVWVKEMTEEEVRQAGESVPTIDSIQVAEFETPAALKQWVGAHAPSFL